MFLKQLYLINFKNYSEAELDFSEKINCFIGNNGAGKTNILDAIYYLSFCKSYFNAVDMQNIRHGMDFFSIHGRYFRHGDEADNISCVQKRNQKKSFKFNKKEYDRLADHIGKFPLVMVSPYDRDLINEGSDVRRKFIDGVIAQFDPIYLNELIKYNKALLQRNVLLKQFAEQRHFDADQINVWDKQLVSSGQVIYEGRKKFLSEFIPIFRSYYAKVANDTEVVDIVYDADMHNQTLEQLLRDALNRDRQSRYTNVGVHKDNLDFLIAGHPLKKFGSQGQQKSFAIAIKLAQFEYTRQIMGIKPVLLFDDIFDKLDDLRVAQLVKLVSNNDFGQIFITDTQRQRVEKLFENSQIDHRIFEVINGQCSLVENNI
jgi:DNA replication and repair protein RecF